MICKNLGSTRDGVVGVVYFQIRYYNSVIVYYSY